jgi:hypothetical protein
MCFHDLKKDGKNDLIKLVSDLKNHIVMSMYCSHSEAETFCRRSGMWMF